MDEFEADVLDVVRSARPAVDGVDGEALARLRATIFGEFSSPADDNSPKFEPAPGPPRPALTDPSVAEDEAGGEVLELATVGGGGRRPNRWRAVALVAAAAMVVAGLTTVAIARRSAPVGVGEGWTGPTADDFATSQYAVTRLVDGTTEVPFDERLRIGLLDPPPGAGVVCRQSQLPPGAGSGTIVVKDGRVAQWVPCDLVDPPLIAFLDALMRAHPTVEVRGDDLRLRAGARELDAVRPRRSSSALAGPGLEAPHIPTMAELADSQWEIYDATSNGVAGTSIVGQMLWFGTDSLIVGSACSSSRIGATIVDGHLTASGEALAWSWPGSASFDCAPSDPEPLAAFVRDDPSVLLRGDVLHLESAHGEVAAVRWRTDADPDGASDALGRNTRYQTLYELAGRTFVIDRYATTPSAGAVDRRFDRSLVVTFAPIPDASAVQHVAVTITGTCPALSAVATGLRAVEVALRPGPADLSCVGGAAPDSDDVRQLAAFFATPSVAELDGPRLTLSKLDAAIEAHEGGAPVPARTTTTTLDPQAARTPTMDELLGRTFVGDRLTVDGTDAPMVTAPVTVTFGLNGQTSRVGAYTGCNGMSGAASIASGHLRLGSDGLVQTQIACGGEPGANEVTVGRLLDASPTISIADGVVRQPAVLVLSGGGIELRAHEQADGRPSTVVPSTTEPPDASTTAAPPTTTASDPSAAGSARVPTFADLAGKVFVADWWLVGRNRQGFLGSPTLTFSRDVDGDQLAVAIGCNGVTATVSVGDDRLGQLGYGRTPAPVEFCRRRWSQNSHW